MQDYAAGCFQLLDHGARTISCGLDDADAFVDDCLCVAVVVRRDERGEEGEVYAEGESGEGFAALDFGAEGRGGGLSEGCELCGDVSR